MLLLGPRLVVAGTHSGVGKTTVATGLMRAMAARGLRVASAKVGPDFIDPSYHAIATGRPGRSLDAWLSGEALLPALAASGAHGTDVLVVEGVMGMFDGSSEPGTDGSTASVARLLSAPVVLVIDASAMSGSVAAIVHGFRTFDPTVRLAGVVLNRVGSAGHATMLREAIAPVGVPVLGVLQEDPSLAWRERHLGLVPVAESPREVAAAVERVGAVVGNACDLEAILAIARSAPREPVTAPPAALFAGCARVAVASGPAFSFTYPENLELLAAAGAELVPFDPLADQALPDGCSALYAGGGFPEVFAPALAANQPLIDSVRAALEVGMVAWAECGGLLWLCRSLDGARMVGAVPADARMTDGLTIGYRTAVTQVASPFGPAGTTLRGHEFHRSTVSPTGDALALAGRFGRGEGGFAAPRLFASYLHQHLAAHPALASRFVGLAHAAGAA